MDRDYTITRVERRDEWGPFHGSMMQDYVIALQGEEGWIKLTQKVDTSPPQENSVIHGVIENKTFPNGDAYKKFKKVNPNYSGGGQGNRSAYGSGGGGQQSNAGVEQLSYIVQMLEELTGRRDVVHDVPDEPLEDPFAGMGV